MDKARQALEKELTMNNVQFEHGDTIYRFKIENTPKARMAIRMIKERFNGKIKIIES